jgi:signal transduction histidine kinase
VHADRDRLAQALDNLIDNAIHHGRGTVTISASATAAAVTIEVHDEGPGLGAEFAEHAFDRFTTSDASRSGAGTGLGLAIVAAISAAHGGRAMALDGPGGAVRIVLPAEAPADGQVAPESAVQPAPA